MIANHLFALIVGARTFEISASHIWRALPIPMWDNAYGY
jgi:hypothetical protein